MLLKCFNVFLWVHVTFDESQLSQSTIENATANNYFQTTGWRLMNIGGALGSQHQSDALSHKPLQYLPSNWSSFLCRKFCCALITHQFVLSFLFASRTTTLFLTARRLYPIRPRSTIRHFRMTVAQKIQLLWEQTDFWLHRRTVSCVWWE